MKTRYDFVYLTNTPSFYKLNLCNRIACTHSILLVLYGYGSEAVNKELQINGNYKFDFYFLNDGDSNTRNKWMTFLHLLRLMNSVKVKKIIFAGWMAPEYNLYALFSPKSRNVMVCESSIFDVTFHGIAGLIKKIIIHRMSVVLPSGRPHDDLFKSIGFKGIRKITGSVGIFNKLKRQEKEIHHPLKYLYVGRLVDVKNLSLLISEFNATGKPLTIVGSGPLEYSLKQIALSNIAFKGFIENEKLGDIYQEHDVFILPSYYEPWGLVVEEALYWGLPVVVSNKVGSSVDMVQCLETGCIFESNNIKSLHSSIVLVESKFSEFRNNVKRIDWEERDRQQIAAYTSLVDRN